MTRYVQVTARWQGDGWSAHLPELGGVSAPSLVELRQAVDEAYWQACEADTEDRRVTIQPKLPLELGAAVADTRSVREEAASLAARAEQLTDLTAAQLRAVGLSDGDVAVVLGLPVPAVEPVSEPSVVAAVPAPVRRPPGRPRKVQSA